MNRFAYLTTRLAIKTLSNLSKARIRVHGEENIRNTSGIFVINHFTRIETLFIPYHIFKIINIPVWSLADSSLFAGPLNLLLDQVGAVSTENPDRDHLIVKSLLTGEASWVIFPEGRMVKNKKIIEKGRFMISYAGGKHPPHTGAASYALRTEFYRRRIQTLIETNPDEARRLLDLFNIKTIEEIKNRNTQIIPVNVTYYPIRAQENVATRLAEFFLKEVQGRLLDEIMAEGTMLLRGVDVDIRFGKPVSVRECLDDKRIQKDIVTKRKIDFDDVLPSKHVMRRIALKIMNQYMEQIYNMTTVNHEHILASLIKVGFFDKFDGPGLKRKLYYFSMKKSDFSNTSFHKMLEKDQAHLLVDDKYNQFKDLIDLALEKKVVDKVGTFYKKNNPSFFRSFDFHKIRFENPIKVIANEIEALKSLQRRIKYISLLPQFFIKRKISSHLIKRELTEFEEDYKFHYIKGETKPKEVGAPFLIKGRNRKIGIVLVHGYMAAPLEIRALAEYLGKQGFWVYGVRLRGHGTSPEDLASRTHIDWQESVDRGYAIMSNICKKVILGGFSTGGGLVLGLASRIPDISGTFAINPPVRLQDMMTIFVPAVDIWNRIMDRIRLDTVKKEFTDNPAENPHINYLRNPVSGLRELDRLMKRVEPTLKKINTPVLIIQSDKDPVVNPKGASRIYDLIKSKDKELVLLKFAKHNIVTGDNSEITYKVIGNFVDRIRSGKIDDLRFNEGT